MTASVALNTATDDLPPEEPVVSFDRTLPRHLVHRAANAEVLLTSYHQERETGFVLGAQLPRTHALYRPIQGCYDPMLFVEAARQAALVVGQVGFGVPQGYQFVLWTMSYDLVDDALRLDGSPADVTLDVECHDVTWRAKTFAGARLSVTAHRDGSPVGRAELTFSCLSPAVFARLRGGVESSRAVNDDAPLPDPVAPELVGQTREFDVALAPTDLANTWLLRVNTAHPVLFDHPLEHVPGMTALEGARQAIWHHLFPRTDLPVGLHAEFHRYIELNEPCSVRLDPDTGSSSRLRVALEQRGHIAAEALFTVHAGDMRTADGHAATDGPLLPRAA